MSTLYTFILIFIHEIITILYYAYNKKSFENIIKKNIKSLNI